MSGHSVLWRNIMSTPLSLMELTTGFWASRTLAVAEELGFTDVHTIRFEAAGANGVVIGRKP